MMNKTWLENMCYVLVYGALLVYGAVLEFTEICNSILLTLYYVVTMYKLNNCSRIHIQSNSTYYNNMESR
jgi:hypothetical protein